MSTHITRELILATRETHIYLYADDATRRAHLGQAEECSNCPSAFPITTKLFPCKDNMAYFNDAFFVRNTQLIEQDIINMKCVVAFRTGLPFPIKIVILPKIGRGCAEMHIRAPKTYAYLLEQLCNIDPTYEK